MKKSISSVFVLLFVSVSVFAQFETVPSDGSSTSSTKTKTSRKSNQVKQQTSLKDKLVVGGGLDLQFGTITSIGITPLVGYLVTDDLMVGGVLTYRYFKNDYVIPSYSTSTYGVAPFARYNIFKGLFAHVEYEMLYGEWIYQDQPFWLKSFFVGGGYNMPIGDRGFAGVYFLWNLTEDDRLLYQPYNNPTMRVSFGVGL